MRLYTMSIDAVAVTAGQDLFNLTATSGMAFRVHAVYLGQKTLTTAEMKQVVAKRFPATVTAGSGGSAGTIRKVNYGDAAATVTGRINDTTNMTTSGTAETLYSDVWHFLNGLIWTPGKYGPIIQPSQGFNFALGTAPSGSMTVNGSIVFEELY